MRRPGAVIAWLTLFGIGAAWPPPWAPVASNLGAVLAAEQPGEPNEPKTLKERLSDKASDGQRVDNCTVPLERRGATPRPDCADRPDARLTLAPQR